MSIPHIVDDAGNCLMIVGIAHLLLGGRQRYGLLLRRAGVALDAPISRPDHEHRHVGFHSPARENCHMDRAGTLIQLAAIAPTSAAQSLDSISASRIATRIDVLHGSSSGCMGSSMMRTRSASVSRKGSGM